MTHSSNGGNIARSLLQQFAPRQLVTDPVELLTYETDASLMDRGSPDGVIFADTPADVVRALEWARQNGLPLIARGSGTGLSGGAVPDRGGVILSFARMNRVIELDAAGRSASVDPGVVNLAFDELVKTRGLYFPPDPASGRTATIGGNIAENAGGPHCFKYGVTTNYVTGLDLILADGARVRTGGSAFDYSEYDFTGLINGSEGTLAVITRADLRLIRNPLAVRTALAAFDTVESAGAAVSAVIARGLVPATMEMMDQRFMRIIEDFCHPGYPCDAGALLIIEADGYPESVGPQIEEIAEVLQAYHPTELRIARDAAERDRFWYGRKSAAGAKSRISPAYYLVDCTVPRSQLAQTLAQINEICDAEGLPVAYVFHAGDGNLHPSIFIPDPSDPRGFEKAYAAGRKVMELCVSKDGSITGEHGTGLEKRGYMPLMFTHAELQAMRDVKLAFDSGELLNPGKILPDESEWPAPLPLPPVSGAATGVEPSFAPATTGEAASCVRDLLARDHPYSVRVQGGGTKSSLLPPAGAYLSTARLRGVTAYAPDDLYVTAGAGTTLADLQAELARSGMMVPLVSPWKDATLGGIVSTGFNAPLRMRYGGVRDLVLSATVVLPDGRQIRTGRPVVKNVAGYDMTKLFVGAHGTLGLLADLTFKLSPLPRAQSTLVIPVEKLGLGMRWGERLLGVCSVASALLLLPGADAAAGAPAAPYALVYTAEGVGQDVEAELAQVQAALASVRAPVGVRRDDVVGSDTWGGWLRSRASAATDVRAGVPVRELAGLMEAAGEANSGWLADLASGLLYLRYSGGASPNSIQALQRAAEERGGYAIVLAGPSGSEMAGRERWGRAPESLSLMQAVKAKWDPSGLFNTGAFLL